MFCTPNFGGLCIDIYHDMQSYIMCFFRRLAGFTLHKLFFKSFFSLIIQHVQFTIPLSIIHQYPYKIIQYIVVTCLRNENDSEKGVWGVTEACHSESRLRAAVRSAVSWQPPVASCWGSGPVHAEATLWLHWTWRGLWSPAISVRCRTSLIRTPCSVVPRWPGWKFLRAALRSQAPPSLPFFLFLLW